MDALTSPSSSPISGILSKTVEILEAETGASKAMRNYVLTVVRLLCNTFSNTNLTRGLLTETTVKPKLTSVLVRALLHEDALVRTAAASLAFNVGAWLQNGRVEAVRNGRGIQEDSPGEDEEWEVELVSAIVESLGRETGNEEVGEFSMISEALLLVDPIF